MENNEELEQRLREYRQSIEQEFETSTSTAEGKVDPTAVRETTRNLLSEAVPRAVARLRYLIDNGKNEAVQLKASQFVINAVLGKDGALAPSPIEELLKEINAASDLTSGGRA